MEYTGYNIVGILKTEYCGVYTLAYYVSIGLHKVLLQSDITSYWPGMHSTAFLVCFVDLFDYDRLVYGYI